MGDMGSHKGLEVKGKRVAVLGAGRSGLALARVLAAKGARVVLSDRKSREDLPACRDLPPEVDLDLGGHTQAVYQEVDLICLSPGIPADTPALEEGRRRGIPVLGEVEVAYRLSPAPFVAVTGTNGKGTTVSMIHAMLLEAGIPSLLAGNIGIPLVGEVESAHPQGYVVAEISSFQLESIVSFRPRLAAVLNVTPDHQDRHPSYGAYLDAKARLFMNQDSHDLAILNADDPGARSLAARVPSRLHWFSRKERLVPGAYLDGEGLVVDLGEGPRFILATSAISLPGPHNLENALAASLAALLLGVKPGQAAKVLANFRTLHHRLEPVGTVAGVSFYDDSKGTNPEAVMAALESFSQPLVIIAGGRDKGLDFTALGRALARRARALVTIGEAGPRIAQAARAGGLADLAAASSLEEAVHLARDLAGAGGAVVLSPGCASFDMFRSAEERGEIFARLVKEMEG